MTTSTMMMEVTEEKARKPQRTSLTSSSVSSDLKAGLRLRRGLPEQLHKTTERAQEYFQLLPNSTASTVAIFKTFFKESKHRWRRWAD